MSWAEEQGRKSGDRRSRSGCKAGSSTQQAWGSSSGKKGGGGAANRRKERRATQFGERPEEDRRSRSGCKGKKTGEGAADRRRERRAAQFGERAGTREGSPLQQPSAMPEEEPPTQRSIHATKAEGECPEEVAIANAGILMTTPKAPSWVVRHSPPPQLSTEASFMAPPLAETVWAEGQQLRLQASARPEALEGPQQEWLLRGRGALPGAAQNSEGATAIINAMANFAATMASSLATPKPAACAPARPKTCLQHIRAGAAPQICGLCRTGSDIGCIGPMWPR